MALSQSELAEFREQLDKRYQSLRLEVRDEIAESGNPELLESIERHFAGSSDRSGDVLADLNVAIIDRHVQELRDIEAAKARIEAGQFGSCIDCGVRIGIERLRAYPVAKRCFVCQHRNERTSFHQATPTL